MNLLEFYAELKAAVRGWALALRDRLQRTTPRERVLLMGLLLGALIYAPVATLDWRANQETRYIDALSDRSAARLTREAARRIASRAPDQSAIEDMKTWGFDADNVQIAQVYIEQALVKSAEEAGLTNVRITTDVAVEPIGAVTWLGAQVQADLRWTPAFAFLDQRNEIGAVLRVSLRGLGRLGFADMAPRPDSSNSGERSIRVATMMIAANTNRIIFANCT